MANDSNDIESPKKGKSFFGTALLKLGRKKKTPSPKEVERDLTDQLRLDRTAVEQLQTSLTAVGTEVPLVITQALLPLDGRLPKQEAQRQSKEKLALALEAREAVSEWLKARVALQVSKDEAGLLVMGSHPMVAKFTMALDGMAGVSEKRWKAAGTGALAKSEATTLAEYISNGVRNRAEAHEALVEADKKIRKAEQAVSKVTGTATVKTTQASDKVKAARKALTEAKLLGDVPKAVALMQGYEELLGLATEGESETLAGLAEFRKLRQTVMDQIGFASQLRGALQDTPLRDLLNLAKIDVERADEAFAKARSSKAVETAMGLLKEHKGLLSKAEKLAAELKKQDEKDLATLPKYTSAYQALQRARDEMAGLPGVEKSLQEADALLRATQLGSDGRPPKGFAAAFEALQGKAEALLGPARKNSENMLKQRLQQFPGLAAAKQKAEDALIGFSNAHPPARTPAERELLSRAIEADDPIAALGRLVVRWQQAVGDQRELDRQLHEERQTMADTLETLTQLNAPKDELKILENTEPLDRLRDAHEFGQALAMAKRANEAAGAYLKVARELKTQWDESSRKLVAIETAATQWQKWPALAQEAGSIAGDALRTRTAVEKGGALQPAIAAEGRITLRFETLVERAKALNLGEASSLDEIPAALEELRSQWGTATRPVGAALSELANMLKEKGVGAGAEDTVWHQQYKDLRARFELALKAPKIEPGDTPAQSLQKLLAQYKREAQAIQEGAIGALDTTQLSQLAEEGKAKDEVQGLKDLWSGLADGVRTAQAVGAKVDAFWAMLGTSFDPAKAPELKEKWTKLKPVIEKTIESRRVDLAKQRESGNKMAVELDKKLLSFFSRNQQRFPGFFEDLRGRTEDARLLLASDDIALVNAGLNQLAELNKQINEARKGGESDSGGSLKTFDDVADMWQSLSNQVGQEVLMKRMPATYQRLYAQLQSLTDQSKRLPPDQGWALLATLQQPLTAALQQAEGVAARYTVFKARKEQLRERLVELHKLTKTRFTEKTEAYDAKFETRLAEAKTLAKQEGEMDRAFGVLNELDKELTGLLSNPDTARDELRKLDNAAMAEQRELRDLARAWEEAQAYWDDKLLPQVAKAIAKRGEEDNQEYGDLKASVSRCSAPLKGYLKVISSLPHEYLSANPSPDMAAARKAFAGAHNRLQQLQKVANRMISGGGTTNVELQKDLTQLENEWVQRAQRAKAVMERLANSVRELPDQAGTVTTDTATYLPQDALGRLKTACNVLGKVLPETAARFDEAAFARPLSVLRAESSSDAERKQAREQALRTMRQMRDELVQSDLLRSIFDGCAKGHLAVDVRPEIGLLRACLKKIELAVLVAV